jgi:hypothetical protein
MVVGGHGAGKRTVAAGLARYQTLLTGTTTTSNTTTTFNPATLESATVLGLSKGILATCRDVIFDNKYYRAKVQVWAVQTSGDAPLDIILPDNVSCQAVVGVFDGSSNDANSQSESVVSRVAALTDVFCPDIVAIVATHSRPNDSVCTATETWCNTHGAEFLVSNVLGNPMRTCNDRNKEGLPRLWELLETVMWSSMDLKPRGGAVTAAVAADDTTNTAGTAGTATKQNNDELFNSSIPVVPCCAFVSFSSPLSIAKEVACHTAAFNKWHTHLFPSGKVPSSHDPATVTLSLQPNVDFDAPLTTALRRMDVNVPMWEYDVTNKYYTATTRMVACDMTPDDDMEALAHDLRDAGCTVLVGVVHMDSTVDNNAALGRTKQMLGKIQGPTGASTTLLMIANATCLTENDRRATLSWCLEHHAETVEITTTASIPATYATRDKKGYARMHEALSSVRWSTAVFQDESMPADTSAIRRVQAPSSNTAAATHKGSKKKAVGMNQVVPPIAPPIAPTAVASGTTSAPITTQSTTDDSDVFWEAMQSAVSEGQDGDNEDMMGNMDALSSLVSQARAVRRAGEQGTMSDEERHAAAMRVALQLASAMGLGDEMGEGDLDDFSDMM